MHNKLPREPKVPNTYNLTISKIQSLKVDWDKVGKVGKHWWRNDIINAWCISKDIGTHKDSEFGTEASYWIGFYDKPYYRKRIHIKTDSYGGITSYKFNSFYRPSDISCEQDLKVQEQLLKEINTLIEDKVLILEN